MQPQYINMPRHCFFSESPCLSQYGNAVSRAARPSSLTSIWYSRSYFCRSRIPIQETNSQATMSGHIALILLSSVVSIFSPRYTMKPLDDNDIQGVPKKCETDVLCSIFFPGWNLAYCNLYHEMSEFREIQVSKPWDTDFWSGKLSRGLLFLRRFEKISLEPDETCTKSTFRWFFTSRTQHSFFDFHE